MTLTAVERDSRFRDALTHKKAPRQRFGGIAALFNPPCFAQVTLHASSQLPQMVVRPLLKLRAQLDRKAPIATGVER